MERYILDTNLFFNMEAGLGMGSKTEEVVKTITKAIQKAKTSKKAEFYMPPRIVDELLSFFEDKKQEFLKNFLAEIIVKSPDTAHIQFPAEIFYRLIDDVRKRSYRGLQIAEEEVSKTAQNMIGKEVFSKKEFQMAIGSVIKGLRDRYRQATRVGFLDSVADLDLIVLAREVDGFVVSTDEGVLVWGRLFGVKEIHARVFGQKLV